MSKFTYAFVDCPYEEYQERMDRACRRWVQMAIRSLDESPIVVDKVEKSGCLDGSGQDSPEHDFSLAT